MLIRYRKTTGRRLALGYEWSRQTGRVRDVKEAEKVVELLLQPGDQFSIDAGEPLLSIAGIDVHVAGNLALAGVASVEQLAGLNAADVQRVAREMRTGRRVVTVWMRAALAMGKQSTPAEPAAESSDGHSG